VLFVEKNLTGFPFAGVATLGLGPLSRAGAAWTFLAAVVAYVLKDATQRGRIHSGKTFRYLRCVDTFFLREPKQMLASRCGSTPKLLVHGFCYGKLKRFS